MPDSIERVLDFEENGSHITPAAYVVGDVLDSTAQLKVKGKYVVFDGLLQSPVDDFLSDLSEREKKVDLVEFWRRERVHA